ncbi:MAG: hypothetical protein QXO69_03685 [archaeon]
MPRESTVKMNTVCPQCYTETGFSIVMKNENDLFQCPKNASHKYRKNEDGFLERTEKW